MQVFAHVANGLRRVDFIFYNPKFCSRHEMFGQGQGDSVLDETHLWAPIVESMGTTAGTSKNLLWRLVFKAHNFLVCVSGHQLESSSVVQTSRRAGATCENITRVRPGFAPPVAQEGSLSNGNPARDLDPYYRVELKFVEVVGFGRSEYVSPRPARVHGLHKISLTWMDARALRCRGEPCCGSVCFCAWAWRHLREHPQP